MKENVRECRTPWCHPLVFEILCNKSFAIYSFQNIKKCCFRVCGHPFHVGGHKFEFRLLLYYELLRQRNLEIILKPIWSEKFYSAVYLVMPSVEEQSPNSCDHVIFLKHMLEFIHDPPELLKLFSFFIYWVMT